MFNFTVKSADTDTHSKLITPEMEYYFDFVPAFAFIAQEMGCTEDRVWNSAKVITQQERPTMGVLQAAKVL